MATREKRSENNNKRHLLLTVFLSETLQKIPINATNTTTTMKLRVTPLLQGDDDKSNDVSFVVDRHDLTPRTFVDWMDQQKALLFQSADEPLTVEDFGQFVVDLQLDHYPDIGGAAPITIIPVKAGEDIVFTANERCVSTASRIVTVTFFFSLSQY